MEAIYHGIGFAMVWIIIATLMVLAIWYGSKWLIKHVWRTSWLAMYIDYIIMLHLSKKPLKKSYNGYALYDYEYALKWGYVKDPYKDTYLNVIIPRILNLNPLIAEDYQHHKSNDKEYKDFYLRSKEWTTYYNPEYWVHWDLVDDHTIQDHTNYGMDIWSAYELQKKWEKEIK